MDQDQAPLVEALAEYHERGRYGFTPPAHRQVRGVDDRTRQVIGVDAFKADVLASAGLDDRSSANGYLKRAEELMADAVGADHGRDTPWRCSRCPRTSRTGTSAWLARGTDHPYPPGIPAILPGERITADVLDYLRTGLEAGMVLPDPADPALATIRVTRR